MGEYPIVLPMCIFSYNPDNAPFSRAEGIMIEDVNGKRYIDAISGLWNVSWGYGNEQINQTIINQIQKLSYCNLIEQPADITVKYAENLLKSFCGEMEKLIYTCSGSESVELAIKLMRKYQMLICKSERKLVGALSLSYHGTTYAAMSVSGIDRDLISDYYPIVDGIKWIDVPVDDYKNVDLWIKNINCFIETYENELAGIIVEPVIGSGGIIEVPKDVLRHLKMICERNEIVLVFDEVATGFGRTGYLFSCFESEVYPDIICLSKGINNGTIPMGAIAINKKIKEVFLEKSGYVEHFSTQNGNPIACAAAIATLDLLQKDSKLFRDSIINKSKYLTDALRSNLKPINVTFDIRCKGLMIGIDLKMAKDNSVVSEFKLGECRNLCRKKGLLIYSFYTKGINSGFSFFPSFITDEEDIDIIVSKFVSVINKFRF